MPYVVQALGKVPGGVMLNQVSKQAVGNAELGFSGHKHPFNQ
jgi:hypothetical protein